MAGLSSRAQERRSREKFAREARENERRSREKNKKFQVAPAPISSRFLCPRPPLLISSPNQNRHATQATVEGNKWLKKQTGKLCGKSAPSSLSINTLIKA